MVRVAGLWRHPVKSHGRERVAAVTLEPGAAFPFDRRWAVVHDAARYDGGWAPCQMFQRGARIPALAGIWAELEEERGILTLRHRDLGEITFRPDDPQDAARFIAWTRPLTPDTGTQPTRLVTAGARGMTDSNFPSVSIMSTASHAAVERQLGRVLERERWRGNIWLEGTAPWAEFDWVGQRVRIGEALLDVVEPIQRCSHTQANPVTGARDADTLSALEAGWGHRDFGVYAVVIEGGRIKTGDFAEVL